MPAPQRGNPRRGAHAAENTSCIEDLLHAFGALPYAPVLLLGDLPGGDTCLRAGAARLLPRRRCTRCRGRSPSALKPLKVSSMRFMVNGCEAKRGEQEHWPPRKRLRRLDGLAAYKDGVKVSVNIIIDAWKASIMVSGLSYLLVFLENLFSGATACGP